MFSPGCRPYYCWNCASEFSLYPGSVTRISLFLETNYKWWRCSFVSEAARLVKFSENQYLPYLGVVWRLIFVESPSLRKHQRKEQTLLSLLLDFISKDVSVSSKKRLLFHFHFLAA